MDRSEVIKILLVEDEEFDVRRIRKTISYYGTRIEILDVVSNGLAALELLKDNQDNYDIAILDYPISGGLKGEELIINMKGLDPLIQIIVITKMTINITNYDFANSLLRAGAFWYCTKYPSNIENYIYQPTDFLLSIFNAYDKKKLERNKLKSEKKLCQNVEKLLDLKMIIGESEPMLNLKESIEKYARSEANILINGASGTGKELVAWNIHLKSKRKHENFIPINCGSIPGDLIESELFGREKGAYTGAVTKQCGRFEAANGSTLFLDEVGELPLEIQAKLLRVIQEKQLERLGSVRTVSVDVRIIAASNQSLIEMVRKGRFREDLYFRLNVIPIEVPPLRRRLEDIPILVETFLGKCARQYQSKVKTITKEALDLLA